MKSRKLQPSLSSFYTNNFDVAPEGELWAWAYERKKQSFEKVSPPVSRKSLIPKGTTWLMKLFVSLI